MRVVAIVQARIGSSRLPGKVLFDIGGRPMIARVVARTRRAKVVDDVYVATTTGPADDRLAEYCGAKRIPSTRGSEFDVLDRYLEAARASKAEIVVRITGDCPLIDPGLIDDVVNVLLGTNEARKGTTPAAQPVFFDFAANRLPPPWKRTYPIGLDTEACAIEALERAWKEAAEPHQREHVMPYFYEGVTLSAADPPLSTGFSPRGFRIALLNHEPDLGAYRWTVDTAEDLEFVRLVYSHFDNRDEFSWRDVVDLISRQPELMQINADVQHKSLGDVDERAPGRP